MPQVEFYLNNQLVKTDHNPAATLLDYIRYTEDLPGTKIGCREGDCGACTILIGEFIDNDLVYRSLTSCITPLANVHGKHVVTIEGINREELTMVQQYMVEEGGTQCGFCTVGFIVSLTGYCLNYPKERDPIVAISGNICRCTGYKSIERAATKINHQLDQHITSDSNFTELVKLKVVPEYFTEIVKLMQDLQDKVAPLQIDMSAGKKTIAGGTDLYVQQHEVLLELPVQFIAQSGDRSYVREENRSILVGGNTTATEFMEHPVIRRYLPEIDNHFKLVASAPIRNIATMAGNIVNASPIGDFTNMFLALDAVLHIEGKMDTREVPLREFYSGYKQFDLEESEYIKEISFPVREHAVFNFEKVSKRTYLDIASVNSSMLLTYEDKMITHVSIAAGGVAPYPIYLDKTCEYLQNKPINTDTITHAALIAKDEVTPISDVRGSAKYKRLLLRQLILAHFIELFPDDMKSILEVLQ